MSAHVVQSDPEPGEEVVRAAVEILWDAFAPDEGGAVTAESFMAAEAGRSLSTVHGGAGARGDDVLAFARTDCWGDRALLSWLAVAEGHRSTGLGTTLIERCVDVVREQGAGTLLVECRVDDYFAPRRRFYERHGFRELSGGDYWLESHQGHGIQYDLLVMELRPDPDLVEAALETHDRAHGIRRDRLDRAVRWTLRGEYP